MQSDTATSGGNARLGHKSEQKGTIMSKFEIKFGRPTAKAVLDARDNWVLSDEEADRTLSAQYDGWCRAFDDMDRLYCAEEYTKDGILWNSSNVLPSEATDYFVEKDVVDFVTVLMSGTEYPGLYRWDDGHVLVFIKPIPTEVDMSEVHMMIRNHLGDLLIEIEKKVGIAEIDWEYYAEPYDRWDCIVDDIIEAIEQTLDDAYGIEVK